MQTEPRDLETPNIGAVDGSGRPRKSSDWATKEVEPLERLLSVRTSVRPSQPEGNKETSLWKVPRE